LPQPTIRDFELGNTDPKQRTVRKWRRALEAAGVEFQEETETSGPGVRLKKQAGKSDDSPRHRHRDHGTKRIADAIIEIASVDVLADGTIANRQEALICPPIPVPPEASAVHHLLYQDLTGKPALRDVLPAFQGADA
jgi:DNA polymerase III epsilon subunit-like protein